MGFLLPFDPLDQIEAAGTNLVSYGSSLDKFGESRSTYPGLLPDPEPDLDAMGESTFSLFVFLQIWREFASLSEKLQVGPAKRATQARIRSC